MMEPVFVSALTMEEMEANFVDVDLFRELMSALDEVIQLQKSEGEK